MPLQYTCVVCGKTFKVPPSRVKRGDPLKFCSRTCHFQSRAQSHVDIRCALCGAVMAAGRISMPATRKYCSQTCYNLARQARVAARAQRRQQQGMTQERTASSSVCATCGARFAARPSAIAAGKRFCSFACRDAESRVKRQRICETCGQSYMAETANTPSRFCSAACRIASRTKPPEQFRCLHCGCDVVRRAGQKRGRFCSTSCASTWRVRHTDAGFKPALRRLTLRKPYETPGYRKKATAVRKRDGYRCQECGRQWMRGQRSFEVHHVIPIRLGGTDAMHNLITLCVRCHRLADLALRPT